MMNGTNALTKTVWLWVDVLMHAMATGIVKIIAMMISLNDSCEVELIEKDAIFS